VGFGEGGGGGRGGRGGVEVSGQILISASFDLKT